MAKSTFRSRSTLLIIAAIAVTGGFFYWIYAQTQALEEEIAPVMEEEAEAADGVTVESLLDDPEAAIGQEARLEDMPVGIRFGRGVFSLVLEDEERDMDYPVLLSPDLIGGGIEVFVGDRVDVEGRIFTLNDSIRQSWIDAGAAEVDSPDELPEVSSFLLATEVSFP